MDRHHKAHYAAHGLLLCAIAAGAWALHSSARHDLPPSYAISDAQLRALPFGPHDYTIYAGVGSGRLPNALAKAIEASGRKATIENAQITHDGVWIGPNRPEIDKLSEAMSEAIGEPVKVGRLDDGEFAIGIGRPIQTRPE